MERCELKILKGQKSFRCMKVAHRIQKLVDPPVFNFNLDSWCLQNPKYTPQRGSFS
jgi:hypothetical protein